MGANVYAMVTEKIVAEMEKGIIPWQKPWAGLPGSMGGAINYVTRRPYSFLNQCLLGKPGEWITFKQVQELKGKVKKGSHGAFVVFYTMTAYPKVREGKPVLDDDGNQVMEQIPILRYYNVFHLDDVEGIESKLPREDDGDKPIPTVPVIDVAEAAISGYLGREKELKFINGTPSDGAYYSPVEDKVQVPMLEQYAIAEEYYSTTFHELIHSTAKKSRCDRAMDEFAFFGSESYSREELVAEMGAAMLCNRVGIDCESAFRNSVAYLQSWLKALKNDTSMIVWAASRAEKAARFILGENDNDSNSQTK